MELTSEELKLIDEWIEDHKDLMEDLVLIEESDKQREGI